MPFNTTQCVLFLKNTLKGTSLYRLQGAQTGPKLTRSLSRPHGLSGFLWRHYSNKVHEHFNNPRNVGSLDDSDPSVGTAIVGKASCGDVIKLQVKVKDNIIEDVKFKTFGCGSAIASTSYATELIKGKSFEEALKIKNTDISKELNLPPVKIHCSLLAEDAIKLSIEDYKKKNALRDP